MQIVKLTGPSSPTVRRAIDGDASGGLAGIKPSRRDRAAGQGRALSPAQEASIQRIICDQRPEQVKMEFALWNRAAVTQLIEQECSMTLSVRGVGTYLARCGFTPQKPIKKADERRPEAVQARLDETYPAIEKRANAEGAQIQ
ncbi:hypothetical protein XpopCFBP1817_10100 [Xanthomonas populi]|uniref:Winged helix-turn helix domain-containing protein n=2 Tax=Xanthomonas populi TaxID=53414 RepID=A0A2S7EPD1_9XANT|nr:hypothetical protein XpopCFBP1817_10100 [Xanthomonas populi]